LKRRHLHKPLVSVIVPALNEEKNIGECLQSVCEQTFKNFELIYVDGGSTDDAIKIARKYADLITYDKGKGPAFARDIGASEARGKYLAFMDGDSRAKHDWLEHIVRDLNEGFVGVGGYVKPKSTRFLHKFMYWLSWSIWPRITAALGLYQFNGANCAFRKTTFMHVGGFSKRLSFLEDVDIALRIKKCGRLKFDTKMIVYTSTRRLEQRGYLDNFFMYVNAWIRYFLGKPIKAEYFKKIKH
jgi:glycosyltransferase involved in cell wall biosynthesis